MVRLIPPKSHPLAPLVRCIPSVPVVAGGEGDWAVRGQTSGDDPPPRSGQLSAGVGINAQNRARNANRSASGIS
ncbi:hypothetical protein KEM60_03182 [Austwickia sp. TVS 96-490-7B]|nr:hypothetical protein [Austwickia sp. TVS 96-490-7B]